MSPRRSSSTPLASAASGAEFDSPLMTRTGAPEGPGCGSCLLRLQRRRHGDDRLVELDRARRSEERCVAEGEDTSVGGHHPVALAGRRRRRPDDGLVELDRARRSEERGTAAEDAAAACGGPEAEAGGGGGRGDERLGQVGGGRGSPEEGAAPTDE